MRVQVDAFLSEKITPVHGVWGIQNPEKTIECPKDFTSWQFISNGLTRQGKYEIIHRLL
jgi:hypothetical protein